MMNNPAMQGMMSQMMQNPELMRSMFSNPQVQSTMNQLQGNPELFQQLMANNPLLNSNPQMAEAMRENLPQIFQQVLI